MVKVRERFFAWHIREGTHDIKAKALKEAPPIFTRREVGITVKAIEAQDSGGMITLAMLKAAIARSAEVTNLLGKEISGEDSAGDEDEDSLGSSGKRSKRSKSPN